jgi:membrane fusion protein, multidrug efflux system
MRKTLLIVAVIVIALVVIKKVFIPSRETAPAQSGGKTPPVGVNVMVAQPVLFEETVASNGTLMANEEVELRAELSGRVQEINFKEGAAVSAGQLLVKINDAELRAQLNKVNLSLKLAEQKLERNRKLLQLQGISQEEFDVMQNEVESLKAEKALVFAQLEKSEIRAPFSGVAGLRQISAGAYVTNQQLIATLKQVQPIKIDFSIPENYIGRVHAGDTISFTVGSSAKKYNGRVYAIEPGIDAGTRSIHLRALSTNSDAALLPGAFAHITLKLNTTDALLIPTQAIVPVLKGKQVFVVRNGKADTVSVVTGIRNDSAVQVISGLVAGDSVITTGLLQLRPGNDVKIRPGKQ